MPQQKGIISPKRITIQVVRRSLLPPAPGTAWSRHDYVPIFTTRAEVKSRMGSNQYAQIDIDGTKATHTFTIRFTTIPFDTRDRVRDATGQMWQILSIENVDLSRREMKIHCANQGSEDVVPAR